MALTAQAANPPETKFINGSGLYFNTIHSITFKFYEEVDRVIQAEPADSADPEILGQLAAIGIVKGKPFAPDARMKKILTDAAAVGNATARAISFRPRNEDFYFYPGKSAWFTPFVGGSHEFLQNNIRLLDARTCFFYLATGITPAMSAKMVGAGSQYAGVTLDADGNYLDGSKNYRLHLPPNIPVKTFWSLIPYDTQTRPVLQTDQRDTALTSEASTVKSNPDGSVDVYFGPKAPPGKESNWIQTVPGKGWFTLLRLYGAPSGGLGSGRWRRAGEGHGQCVSDRDWAINNGTWTSSKKYALTATAEILSSPATIRRSARCCVQQSTF